MASFMILFLYLWSPLVFGWIWSPVITAASSTPQPSSIASTLATVTLRSTITALPESSTFPASSHAISPTSLPILPPSPQHDICLNLTSLQEIYSFHEHSNVTYAQIITECPETCRKAYGDGNADLAGIGVFASYITLLVFSALFGPVLRVTTFLCMCAHNCTRQGCDLDPSCNKWRCISERDNAAHYQICKHEHKYSRFLNFVRSWNELQGEFLDSQAFFVIPAIVASFVELRRHRSIYEVSFIQALGLALSTSLLVCTLARHTQKKNEPARPVNEDQGDVEHTFSFHQLLKGIDKKQSIYLVFSAGSLVVLPNVFPRFISPDLWHLGSACNEIHQWQRFGFGIYYHFSKYKWKIISLAVLALAGVICIAIPVLRLLIQKKLENGHASRLRRLHKWNLLLGQGQDILGISVGTGMAIFWAYHLFTIRSAMAKTVGAGDDEKSWNYGQVTAIFAWVPLVLNILDHLRDYKKWINGGQGSKATNTNSLPSTSATNSPLPRFSSDSHHSVNISLDDMYPAGQSHPRQAAILQSSPPPQLPEVPCHTLFGPDDILLGSAYRGR